MKVHLQIFKPGGKFYTSSDYETTKETMFEIFAEVLDMALAGEIPGLVKHSCWTNEPWRRDWIIHVEAPEHPHSFPGIIPLGRDGAGNRVRAGSGWEEAALTACKGKEPTP